MTDEADVVIEGQIVENSWFVSAINGNQRELEKLYKENAGRQDENGCTALMYTANLGHIDCAKFLIKNCKNELNKIDREGRTALMYGAMTGQVEIVKLLVKLEGGIVDNLDMTAYDHAVKNKHEECAKVLRDTPDNKSGALEENEKNKQHLDNLRKAGDELQKVIDTQKDRGNKREGYTR
jgi:ankyrin repeat protein